MRELRQDLRQETVQQLRQEEDDRRYFKRWRTAELARLDHEIAVKQKRATVPTEFSRGPVCSCSYQDTPHFKVEYTIDGIPYRECPVTFWGRLAFVRTVVEKETTWPTIHPIEKFTSAFSCANAREPLPRFRIASAVPRKVRAATSRAA